MRTPTNFVRWFIPLFLVGYSSISLFRWVTYRHEIYPFSPQGMFQYIRPHHDEYRVLLDDDPSTRQPRALSLDGRGQIMVKALFRLAQEARDRDFSSLRSHFESSYLAPRTTYFLEKRRVWRRRLEVPSKKVRARLEPVLLGPYSAASGVVAKGCSFSVDDYSFKKKREGPKPRLKRRKGGMR